MISRMVEKNLKSNEIIDYLHVIVFTHQHEQRFYFERKEVICFLAAKPRMRNCILSNIFTALEYRTQKYRMEQWKKDYTEAVNYFKEIPLTKTSSPYHAANLYRLSLAGETLGEDDEGLQHLHEAKRIAKVGASYRNWMWLVVALKLRKQYEEIGWNSKKYLREAEYIAENIHLDDVSIIVETLKDLSKQVPALVKLVEWYLDKAKKTMNANDFTKAEALFNAANQPLFAGRYSIFTHDISFQMPD